VKLDAIAILASQFSRGSRSIEDVEDILFQVSTTVVVGCSCIAPANGVQHHLFDQATRFLRPQGEMLLEFPGDGGHAIKVSCSSKRDQALFGTLRSPQVVYPEGCRREIAGLAGGLDGLSQISNKLLEICSGPDGGF
jgi:hypothetical protein